MAPFISALVRLGSEYADLEAWGTVVGFCRAHWEIPVAFAVAYLSMVYATRSAIKPHAFSGATDKCFAVWNLGLSLFSCWGFWHMTKPLQGALREEGLYFTVCADTPSFMVYAKDGPAMFALSLFCLSKIPELGDTVFLILKGRPVRLLQWYHHTTVMLFCWLALATEYTPGIWFAATNYFVHAIMYMYFFLMTFKGAQKALKRIAPLITIIQTTQMVWGLIINGIAVVSYLTTGACQIQAVTVYCAVVMYASYFWLFSKLYLESRATAAKAKNNGEGIARTFSRKISHAFLDDAGEDGDQDCAREKVN